jgi:hypothetical protein
MSTINLIAFGTFGNPNGFKQTFFIGNQNLSKSINTFDLNTNAIKVFANSTIYSIRKEIAHGANLISYSIYSFAKEQNSERSGTFIGSSILYSNKIADENLTINILNEFQENLVDKNVRNDVISVNHSDLLTVIKPKDIDKVEFNLKDVTSINFSKTSNKNLVVYSNTSPGKLSVLFSKALELLNLYDTIYFTQSHEVAEFVGLKGIFKLAQLNDFENEIVSLHEERKRKTENSISEFEREIIKLEDDKNKMLVDFNSQIEQNENIHRENERKILQSRSDLDIIRKIYSDFEQKIRELANQMRSGKKYEDVKLLYEENKKIFITSLEQIRRPNFIHNVNKIKAKTEIRSTGQQYQANSNNDRISNDNRRKKTDHHHRDHHNDEPIFDYYKLATFVLSAALIFSIVAFFIFERGTDYTITENESNIVNNETKQETKLENVKEDKSSDLIDTKSENHEEVAKLSKVDDLKPASNSELNGVDFIAISKRLKHNMPLDNIVQIVYNANPTDVKKTYIGQEKVYGNLLVALNRDCFEEKKGIFYFVKDTLRHIPCYKILK